MPAASLGCGETARSGQGIRSVPLATNPKLTEAGLDLIMKHSAVPLLFDAGHTAFVVEAEQDPKVSPPLEMAKKGHKDRLRVMAAAGYEVVQ